MSSHIEIRKKPEAFDSFQMVFKLLAGVGCYKLVDPPASRFKLYFHNVYRILYVALLAMMNIEHLTFIFVEYPMDVNTILEVLVVEIPMINIAVKSITLFLSSSRLDKLREVIRGPYFAAKGPKDEEYLDQNKMNMEKVLKAMTVNVATVVIVWHISNFLRKLNGESLVVPLYAPIDKDSWTGFFLLTVSRITFAGFLGYANLLMDSLIAIYFSQSTVQLKILKYNLEHMFDDEDVTRATERQVFAYKDLVDVKLRERFIYYVHRYDQIVWFTKEVNSVFNFAMSFQILTSTLASCSLIFNMSNTPVLSLQFTLLMTIFLTYFFEIFVYCYFGYLVEYEHESVCQSACMSDWISLSPSLRNNLLIAMTRWTQPLKICVAVVVPLHINTTIQILRAAYTLFTLVSTTGDAK